MTIQNPLYDTATVLAVSIKSDKPLILKFNGTTLRCSVKPIQRLALPKMMTDIVGKRVLFACDLDTKAKLINIRFISLLLASDPTPMPRQLLKDGVCHV